MLRTHTRPSSTCVCTQQLLLCNINGNMLFQLVPPVLVPGALCRVRAKRLLGIKNINGADTSSRAGTNIMTHT